MKNAGDENEPKENDKMNPGDNGHGAGETNPEATCVKKSSMKMFQERVVNAKTVIEKRYNLIIILLALLAFLLLIIVIALSVKLAGTGGPTKDLCETSACLGAAAMVVRSLNTSVDPCQNFWSYSCDGWINEHPLPQYRNKGSVSVASVVKTDIYRDIRHQIDLIQTENVRSPEWKLKKLYESCMNLGDIEYEAPRWMKRQMNAIGGFSIIGGFQPAAFQRQKVLQRLQVDYGVMPFFKISVGTDDFHPAAAAIKIEPAGLGLPNRNYYYDSKYEKIVDAYKEYMSDLAKELGAKNVQAKTFAQNVFNYEKRIAEISPRPEEWQEPSKIYKKLRIRDLQSRAPITRWMTLLQSHFKETPIRENTQVIVAFSGYFKKISTIFSSTDNSAMNDYMMWKFLLSYIPYLSKPYRDLANDFEQTVNQISGTDVKIAEDRWEYCIGLTNKFMGFAAGNIYAKHLTSNHPNITTEAQKLIESTKSTLLNDISSINWIKDKATRVRAEEKIRALQSSVAFPEVTKNNESMRNHYSTLEIQSSFITNIHNGMYFLQKQREKKLKLVTGPDNIWSINPIDVSTIYQYNNNHLIVASGLLRNPIFNTNLPLAIKFGSLGFQLASQIMNSLSLKGIQYESFGKLLSENDNWISEKSLIALNDTSECMLEDLENNQNSDDNKKINPKLVLSQTLADIGALRLVHDAYKEYTRKHGEEDLLPGSFRHNDQLLFIGLAQSMCESVREGRAKATYESLTTLPAEERVQALFRQVPEFGNAFNCDKDYSNSCPIF